METTGEPFSPSWGIITRPGPDVIQTTQQKTFFPQNRFLTVSQA